MFDNSPQEEIHLLFFLATAHTYVHHTHMYTHASMHTHAHIYAHIYTHVQARTRVHTHRQAYTKPQETTDTLSICNVL